MRPCAQPLFQRSVDSWRHLLRRSIENPDEDKGLVLISLVADGRSVYSFGESASSTRSCGQPTLAAACFG